MVGFLGLIFALMALTCLFGYWISWEVQNKHQRPAFTTKLWNDAMRLLGREPGRITAVRTPLIIAPGKLSGIHVRNAP
jgi:hypothetical protein